MNNQCCDGDLHPESPEFQRCVRALKEIDLELAYLAVLTREGLKPLSRWEKSLTDGDLELLQRTGLITKQVRRTVKTGKEIVETIFSRTPAYIQLYEQTFGNTPIDKSPQTKRFEGFLFGYPPCCVNQTICRNRSRKSCSIGPAGTAKLHLRCCRFTRTPMICLNAAEAQ